MTMLLIFAVIATVFIVAERLTPARPQRFVRRGFLVDCLYTVTNIALRVLVNGTLAIAITRLGRETLPDHAIGVLADQPVWIQAIAIIVTLDFFFYVMHRLKHRWTWWWRLHETHHSSRDLDWFSSVRFHPLEKILDRLIYLFPLTFLGASDQALLILATLDAFIATFAHANLDWRIGPLIYVFVGPEMHRWHHSDDPARNHCNFGNNLSIFDWIFGTAYLTKENPASFGVDDPAYPLGDIVGQFLYAFRPGEEREREAVGPAHGEPG